MRDSGAFIQVSCWQLIVIVKTFPASRCFHLGDRYLKTPGGRRISRLNTQSENRFADIPCRSEFSRFRTLSLISLCRSRAFYVDKLPTCGISLFRFPRRWQTTARSMPDKQLIRPRRTTGQLPIPSKACGSQNFAEWGLPSIHWETRPMPRA